MHVRGMISASVRLKGSYRGFRASEGLTAIGKELLNRCDHRAKMTMQ